jgi:hypothetical protein
MPLPTEVVYLRERLRKMSIMELYARGREALRECRKGAEQTQPLTHDETLVAEIRTELKRRFPPKQNKHMVSSELHI